MGHRRESHGCPWVTEGKVMDFSQKHARIGRTTTHEFPGLSAVYNSLSGPFSLLREP
jgi:hypothetical protein